ncbi:hexokinase-2-like [Silene latifolia]|uniref:hexokinase-2-like n=1 Tax=Silene latifolia TaxID=37657 RepID=UPI003D77FA65
MGECEIVKGSKNLAEMVKKIEQDFWISKDKLREIANDMELNMINGLKDEDSSPIKMLVSYVDSLPTGNEEGRFYALDLGGTNLRVMQVKLQGNKPINIKSESNMVPPELKVGKSHELFDYIAENVKLAVKSEEAAHFEVTPGQKRELGFTFSFPVHQARINSGTLLNWTKDFNIQDAIGKDVVEQVGTALKKQGLDMDVTALLNDTVGSLAGGRFYNKNVVAAVILGTGMNAAYVEQSENILKEYGKPPASGQMVINTEWGNYNSQYLPLTDYDRAIDHDSPNQQKQILEKMLSGRYLGEIVRRILLHLAEDGALFGNSVPPKLRQRNALGTEIVSEMHGDKSTDLSLVGEKLRGVLQIQNVTKEEKQIVYKICEIVATRGARLSAAAILSILKRLGKDKKHEEETVIAVDGSLFAKYEQFNSCLKRTLLEELLDDEEVSKKVVLKQFTDASGIGAALVAASHSAYSCH